MDTPKTKAPRRSNDEIAKDYAARAEAARRRSIEGTEEYKALAAAIEALIGVDTSFATAPDRAMFESVLDSLKAERARLLAPERKS